MTIKRGNREDLEIEIAELIAKKINESHTQVFDLAIPGGRSVSGIFKHLLQQKVDWNKCRIFMLDERLVPTTHQESNYKQAYDDFLHVLVNEEAIQESNIYPFQFNPDVPDSGLAQYNHEFSSTKDHFDLILASAGEDGHIASLYPNHPSIESKDGPYIRVLQSPKPPASRMSASPELIKKSKTAILLFFGESKKEALSSFQETDSIKDLPANLIKHVPQHYIFTDIQ